MGTLVTVVITDLSNRMGLARVVGYEKGEYLVEELKPPNPGWVGATWSFRRSELTRVLSSFAGLVVLDG